MAYSQNHSRTFWCTIIPTTLAIITLMVRLTVLALGGNERRTYQDPVVSKRVVRGTIYDRNGRILSIETASYNIYFRLSQIKDLEATARLISPFLSMSVQEITEKASHYKSYAFISGGIGEREAKEIKELVQREGMANAVEIEKQYGRSYPASFHASQTIGFVNGENQGLEGIEYSQNDKLFPTPSLGTTDPTYGEDVTLTLDIDVQYLLDLEMQRIALEHLPDYAMGIVMDAKSGDLLAISSYPWYDTNSFSTSSEESRINHAVNYLFEPGSVFKVFSLCALMEIGQADFSTPFQCDGSFTFDGITISCHEKHGTVTPKEMIAKSCNGAIANWALQTDSNLFYELLCKLGCNSFYDIGLPSKSQARLADISKWSLRSKPTISFGQEVLVSALHLATSATTLANGGTLLRPHLILRNSESLDGREPGKVTYERKIEQGGNLFSDEIAKNVLQYMHAATQRGGTATLASVEGINVSAKTGTAQLYNPETKSYRDGGNLASTLALVPTENPRFIIYIAAGNPKGNTIWGANIAAPAVGKVIEGLASQGKITLSHSPSGEGSTT